MPLIINTNIASLNAQNNLSTSQSALQTSLQRLSSGLRINSAKDDAAGMAIAARMTSQINGLDQAARNANDGISLAQTASGALNTITDNLQRMRVLAVQAANGTNSQSDRAALQAEITQLQNNINQIATQTSFNGTTLLDGSLASAQFQVGPNANQTINYSIASAQATAIGDNVSSTANGSTNFDTTALSMTQATAAAAVTTNAGSPANGIDNVNNFLAQTLTITGSNGIPITPAPLLAGSTAAQIATAVNAVSGSTGVKATASTSAQIAGVSAVGAVTFVLQGNPTLSGADNPVTISADITSVNDLSNVATAINAQTSVTGITAAANTSNGTINLYDAAGNDIKMTNVGTPTFTLAGSVTGVTPAVQQSEVNGIGVGTPVTLTSGGTSTAVVGGQVQFSSVALFTVSSSVAAGQFLNQALNATGNAAGGFNANSTLSSVQSIDITQMTGVIPTGANSALSVIDAALQSVNSARANLGAIQNRFQSAITNLNTTDQNLTQSRSRIQDTDFAAATAELTRAQILQQAGTAMLAQANALPNGVMTLLR